MRKIIVGNNISEKCKKALSDMSFEVVTLPSFDMLDKPVSSHADMLVFCVDGRIFTHGEYYSQNKELFDSLGVEICVIEERVESKYPKDILLNAVLSSEGVLFSKTEFTAKAVKAMAKELVNVKQGYTACSTCRVTEKAFITTDEGLSAKYREKGILSLTVTKEGISLSGYDCGFIGGASVVTQDAVCFFGKIEDHPDYEAIKDFVGLEGKKVISLSDEKLTDIGGAVII